MKAKTQQTLVVLLAVVAIAGVAHAATGDTQSVDKIDDFEDGDTNIERAHWSGWDDPENVFSTTGTAIFGAHSGIYVPDPDTITQPVSATRDAPSQDWLNFSTSVDGESGAALTHDISVRSGGLELLEIQYAENSTDTYGNITVEHDNGKTKIAEWTESATGVQNFSIDPDFGTDTAEVYLNGSSQGSFDMQADRPGWDELRLSTVTWQLPADDSELRIDGVGDSFTATDPTVLNGTGSPTGDINELSPELSIDIKDPDFGTDKNDSVTVDWYREGSKVATSTLTSNGTATQEVLFPVAGEANWSITATDIYGGSTVSKNFTVETPGNITILDENNPDELVNNTNARLIFYFDNQPVRIETRNTTTGKLNMTGLPTNRPFVVATQTDNWTDRRVYIENLYTQQEIYLVNTTAAADNDLVQPTFDLTDFSGQYPAEDTVLFVQTSINESWTTVEADFFGADGEMTATLQKNQRHRLVIKNVQTGDTQIHNALFPTDSRRHDLTINANEINIAKPGGRVDIDPDQTTLTQGNVTFAGSFQPGTSTLQNYNLTIWVKNSSGRIQLAQLSGSQSSGERLSETLDLTNRSNATIQVRAIFATDSGRRETVWRNYSVLTNYTSATLLDGLQSVPSRLSGDAAGVTMFLATFAAALSAAAVNRQFPASTELLGVVMVAVLGVAYLIGWVPPTYFSVIAAAWVVAAGLRRGL